MSSKRCIHGHLRTPENTHRDKRGYLRCRDCQRNFRHLRGTGSDNIRRDLQGVTATLREQTTRATATVLFSGLLKETMRAVAAECDCRDGDWRVLCLSTPNTIKEDLKGYRVRQRWGGVSRTVFPEHQMLGRIGRIDLLDPSLS
jgi:hypothetical protein